MVYFLISFPNTKSVESKSKMWGRKINWHSKPLVNKAPSQQGAESPPPLGDHPMPLGAHSVPPDPALGSLAAPWAGHLRPNHPPESPRSCPDVSGNIHKAEFSAGKCWTWLPGGKQMDGHSNTKVGVQKCDPYSQPRGVQCSAKWQTKPKPRRGPTGEEGWRGWHITGPDTDVQTSDTKAKGYHWLHVPGARRGRTAQAWWELSPSTSQCLMMPFRVEQWWISALGLAHTQGRQLVWSSSVVLTQKVLAIKSYWP